VGFIDQSDEPLEVHWVVEAVLTLGVDVAEDAGFLAELPEQVGIVLQQRGAALAGEAFPIARLGKLDLLLIGHLEEQQVGDLLDVIAVIDPIVPQRVAEAPEFLDNVGHGQANQEDWER